MKMFVINRYRIDCDYNHVQTNLCIVRTREEAEQIIEKLNQINEF